MPKLQSTLEQLIRKEGLVSSGALRYPTTVDLERSNYSGMATAAYHALGGVLPQIPLRLGSWDLEFDGTAVELDEQLHFNRYRATTLESPAYRDLPAFPLDAYKRYCLDHERRCLRAGGYGGMWSNESCERQFGVAASPGDLSGGGAPRWKQRAFYDFVKDLSPLIVGVAVVRVALWDEAEDGGRQRTVAEILMTPRPSSGAALKALILSRTPLESERES